MENVTTPYKVKLGPGNRYYVADKTTLENIVFTMTARAEVGVGNLSFRVHINEEDREKLNEISRSARSFLPNIKITKLKDASFLTRKTFLQFYSADEIISNGVKVTEKEFLTIVKVRFNPATTFGADTTVTFRLGYIYLQHTRSYLPFLHATKIELIY